jgi:anaerobic ribonucleoside-triphosphate reductase
MNKRKEQITEEIAGLREDHACVHGTECEVYKRVVGYCRNVKNFNKGKAEEQKERVEFKVPPANL